MKPHRNAAIRAATWTFATLATQAMAASVAQAAAPAYPTKPIRFITPAQPGGTTDILARTIGTRLGDAWGQQVVVDNRAAGGGVVAAELTAKAPPDGHTIFMAYHQHTVNAALYPKLPYRVVDDFSPITQVTAAGLVLVVHPTSPVKNFRDFLEWTRNFKGPLNFGSAGNGSGGHLAGELYKLMTGVKAQHVPYKGSGPALIDLAAGHYQFNFSGMQAAQALLRGGRLRALAVTSARRVPSMPDVPTVAESGLAGFEVVGWYGVIGPAKMPKGIVDKLNGEIVRIVRLPEVNERILSEGGEPIASRPDQFAAFLRADVAKWAKVVKESGARID